MNRSMNDLPIEILVQIIGKLSSYAADYLPLKLVSSRWKYSIDCYFATIKHLVHRNGERTDNTILVTKDGLIACKTSNLLDHIISCMKLLPNLTAVKVEFSKYTKKDQDTLFTYLNTRPTITSLQIIFEGLYTRLINDVKLENIRNFALNSNVTYSLDALSRLFQADHKLTQLRVFNFNRWDMPYGYESLVLKRMPTLRNLSQQLQLDHNVWDIDNDTDLLVYIKQPGLSFEKLESCSFHAELSGREDYLNYVDRFVACCPNLKSVECWLSRGDEYEISKLNNLRAFSNIENLAIHSTVSRDSSWEFVAKVLEMFPMVKNLKLQEVAICHHHLSQALLKLPNLSLLYFRIFLLSLLESPSCYGEHQAIVQVNFEALKEEYSSKYGRNLQIVRRDADFEIEEFPFRHGSNFMKNIFWPDWPPRLLAD